MGRLKIEAFFSKPPCANSAALMRLLNEIEKDYEKEVEIVRHEESTGGLDPYLLSATPAVVVEGLIKIMGFCPSKESLISALKEMGLE